MTTKHFVVILPDMSRNQLPQLLALTLILIISGLTLSACQLRPIDADSDKPLNLNLEGTQPTSQATDRVSDSNTATGDQAGVADIQKGPTVKTLSDFTPITGDTVQITTTKGEFRVKLYRDKAPLTTLNFLNLVQDKFYDGIVFHRVIPGFMAQVGDPLTKDPDQKSLWGTGGPGYTIADEFGPGLKHDKKGLLSMANAGPNTGGSQIFITFAPQPHLDGVHAVFGEVVSGMEIVDMITQGDKIISAQVVK